MVAIAGISCGRSKSPQLVFDEANNDFIRGNLIQSQQEARRGYQEFRGSSPKWAERFKILEARATLWRGLFEETRDLLQSETLAPSEPDLTVPALTLLGVANIRLRDFPAAERALQAAADLCHTTMGAGCGEVLQAQGLLASERSNSASAERFYELALSSARSEGNSFLESTSLLNLGAESLAQERFDKALDTSQAAYEAATTIGARIVELTARSNIGWAYYKLGDSEKSLELFLDAEKAAAQLGFIYDQENELTNMGYVYMDRGQFDEAAKSFQRALELAETIKAKQDIYNAQRVLARLALLIGDVNRASEHAEKALKVAQESGSHLDELYPMLVQGQIAARRGNRDEAQETFRRVASDKLCPVSLKWESEHSLARLYEDQQQNRAADREYRVALATFEAARSAVRHQDSRLSFLTNGWHIYDDYVHFLVAHGKAHNALRWADYSRARTLAEGLGTLPTKISVEPGPLGETEIARRASGVLLFYWLGDKQSYVWVITASRMAVTTLPASSEIDAMVRRYRKALAGPLDVLATKNIDGLSLYQTLIAPAQPWLSRNERVFVLPDGSLNDLNFETLLTDKPQPHFWIEDATVVNASSVRVLGKQYLPDTKPPALLLIGNSVAPNAQYPELPKAALQMDRVAGHFPTHKVVLQREQATPQAYLSSNLEQFSHIHFVAHGTASRLSPLDSAIVLSSGAGANDSFKLYARDIIRHPLDADLVTISACYGVGERSYAGEGLVGLSWAFLRAGAHNVVAALWEATDTSTEELMDNFYEELSRGSRPDTALRIAKLSMLRSSNFRNPFYWAPFQLYVRGHAARVGLSKLDSPPPQVLGTYLQGMESRPPAPDL